MCCHMLSCVVSSYHTLSRLVSIDPCRSVDMWGLGCLCHEAHQGLLHAPSDLKTMDKMPKSIIPHYAVLIRWEEGGASRTRGGQGMLPLRPLGIVLLRDCSFCSRLDSDSDVDFGLSLIVVCCQCQS